MSDALEAFRTAYMAGNEAFLRGDFESAFARLPDDLEWHVRPGFPGPAVVVGRRQVTRLFEEIAESMPDFRAIVESIREPVPGVFAVSFRNEATGVASGIEMTQRTVQVWEPAHRPPRVREFASERDAFAAIGAERTETS